MKGCRPVTQRSCAGFGSLVAAISVAERGWSARGFRGWARNTCVPPITCRRGVRLFQHCDRRPGQATGGRPPAGARAGIHNPRPRIIVMGLWLWIPGLPRFARRPG